MEIIGFTTVIKSGKPDPTTQKVTPALTLSLTVRGDYEAMSEPKRLPKDFQPNYVTVDYASTWGEQYKDWFTKSELQSAGNV